MKVKYPKLFSPLRVGNVMLKNRIASAPMGIPHKTVLSGVNYSGMSLLDKSAGGAGIIIVGGSYLGGLSGEDNAFNKYARGTTREVLTVMKQSGGVACIQFGFFSQRFDDGTCLAVSDGIDPFGLSGKEMTKEQIKEQIDVLCDDCIKAKDFGFDMIMLHLAHDSLHSIFMSPGWNKRIDEYGGSLENRMRLGKEIITRVREAVGADFPVMARFSRHLMVEESFSEDDMMAFIHEVYPYLDIVNISAGADCVGGVSVEQYRANTHVNPQALDPRFYNLEFCERVKRELGDKVVVAIVGAVGDPAMCEKYLSEGRFDMVMMARQLTADPYWPKKALEGRDEDIVPCIRCSHCYHIATIHENMQCAVNPRFRRENRVPLSLAPSSEPQKVVVIGGGPAGMNAALTAFKRGHNVILLEKENEPGGQMHHTKYDKFKNDIRMYQDYLIAQLGKTAVDVRLGIDASHDYVRELNPDHIIIAVGADFTTPPIKGIEFSKEATSIYPSITDIRKKTVIIGGGTIGSEIALQLAQNGCDVTLIEKGSTLAQTATWLYRHSLYGHIEKCKSLHMQLNSSVKEIKADGVSYVDTNGKETFAEAELILHATGMASRKELAFSFYGITPNTSVVGDCDKVGNINHAINDSYFVAASI
ncbi:MAG: FAD-dependent oxidoreductase [Defluviitaleaceae bacterium]|nr:FAD-dependent oxidoreductase [Defluviitaleaceae bacterium]